jgi:hypothetical protein
MLREEWDPDWLPVGQDAGRLSGQRRCTQTMSKGVRWGIVGSLLVPGNSSERDALSVISSSQVPKSNVWNLMVGRRPFLELILSHVFLLQHPK